MKKTQCDLVLDYMRQHGEISTRGAFYDLGVTRLASRIHDLKGQGYNIISETKTGRNRNNDTIHYTVYQLVEEKEN